MKAKKSKKSKLQSGQASKLLLVLAVVILVAAVIVYLIMQMAERPSIETETEFETTVVLPIYEQTLGNIKFIFESAINHGGTLYASRAVDEYEDENLTTTENFIEVKIGAQNIGKLNIEAGAWDIQNIVDSEGREFESLKRDADSWLPETDLCEELLKPSFDPTPCVKMYEVSKKSTGLKIRVVTGKGNGDVDSDMKDNDSALIDLIVK